MSNRTKVLERADVSVHADCLESLLDSCRRNGRPAVFKKPDPKIYFDTDRFRWLFSNPIAQQCFAPSMMTGNLTLKQWRDRIDEMMVAADRENERELQ